MQPIIEIKGVGKKYNITHQRGKYVALRDILMGIARRPLAFVIQKTRQVAGFQKKEEFWALRDINLAIRKGEIVGIIGPNGAGKSTLLKILTGITPPTEGEIIMRGRVASLLEVGTGFHPELTGRENIFLNGAILGMKGKEITEKFDEIVSFAGIEKFLDTPVKRYSSGMYVRLAFSVAAHMEPDILLVDEVLAVGDAEFQRKCLGKMEEVKNKKGRTILFVSHNMNSIQSLCQKVILIQHGRVQAVGEPATIIQKYLASGAANTPISERKDRKGDGRLRITDFQLVNSAGKEVSFLTSWEDAELHLHYTVFDAMLHEVSLSVGIDTVSDQHRLALISSDMLEKKMQINPKDGVFKIKITRNPLNVGAYQFTIFINEAGAVIDWVQRAGMFEVRQGTRYSGGEAPKQGSVLLEYDISS